MFKILLITGDHKRHKYFINRISNEYQVHTAIIEKRENQIPKIENQSILEHKDIDNYNRHFLGREKSEEKWLNCNLLNDAPSIINIQKSDWESKKILDLLLQNNYNLCVIFGSSLITSKVRSFLPKLTINLHLGLSPRYKGAATLFWPFYFLEPQFAGSTFHLLLDSPDSGNIIHQSLPALSFGDGIHDVSAKVLIKSCDDLIRIIHKIIYRDNLEDIEQKKTGKNFLFSDFSPEHLRMIYNEYDNNIVDFYLAKKLSRSHISPFIFSQPSI